MDQNAKKEKLDSPALQRHTIPYRTDIDGLRALSIILIVAVHYWQELFPAGTIGVTIFFVISGYLISSIIFKEYINNEFSFRKFYERRVRRIFPSLEILLIVTFAYILIDSNWSTDEGRERIHFHSANTIASALMGNNLYLMFRQKGPPNLLSHLWSLGVEEQFYLIWPLIAGFVIARKRMFDGVLIISILIAISFGIRCYVDVKYSSWFLPRMFCLGRFWQLFFGCLLAYVETKKILNENKDENKNGIENQNFREENNLLIGEEQLESSNCTETLKSNSLLSIFGFVLILAVFLIPLQIFDKYQKFLLLITVLATCIIIGCPNRGVLTKYVLENKVIVYIGKISYDLYLWHFAFQRAFVDNDSNISKFCYIAVSLILSAITFEFTDRKIRRNPHPWIVPILLLVMVAILIAGIVFFCLTSEKAPIVQNRHFFSLRPSHSHEI